MRIGEFKVKKSYALGGLKAGIKQLHGVYEEVTITPSSERQVIEPSGDYDGISKAVVEPISSEYIKPAGAIEIVENGTHNVREYAEAVVNTARSDMLQQRVDAKNSCYYLMAYFQGDNVDFLKDLDTSKVTSVERMFYSCTNLKSIPPLDTSNATNFHSLFRICSSLESVPQLDTSKATTIQEMFSGCYKLTSIPQLDTSNVTNMNTTFSGCYLITSVPLLDTSKVTFMPNLFSSCSNLETVPLLNFIATTSSSSTNSIFYNCSKLTNVTIKNIKYNLQIGSGTSWGHLLTLESLVNTIKELWDYSSDTTTRKLTISTASGEKIASVYVKLVDITDEMRAEDEYIDNKKPCIVCDSTDDGAMLLEDYAMLKNWDIVQV